ncbi:MAG: GNAT family N-acetyltransferase, partial [Clostridia bacterium]|nr:GNAT family N-acetyltransferase [Clostridia bacterium]
MFGLKFSTERLIIREYKKSDIDDFLEVVRQPELYPTTYGIPREYTRKRAKNWLKFVKNNIRTMQSYEFGMFLKDDERYLGNVGLINVSMVHNHADISYYIDINFQNMG